MSENNRDLSQITNVNKVSFTIGDVLRIYSLVQDRSKRLVDLHLMDKGNFEYLFRGVLFAIYQHHLKSNLGSEVRIRSEREVHKLPKHVKLNAESKRRFMEFVQWLLLQNGMPELLGIKDALEKKTYVSDEKVA